jgi:hypothetical protein
MTGDWTVPKQVQARSPKGGNKPLSLPHRTSIFDLRLALPPPSDIDIINGLRVYKLPAGLIATSPTHFTHQPIVMRAGLAAIKDASEVLGCLLEGGHSTIAGRLAGAFRNIGRVSIADNILETMRAAGYSVSETDPFLGIPHVALSLRETSPYVNRVTTVRVVLGHFIFVYIHPYFDGNGRMGRFLMNLMFASDGYPWTVVPVTLHEDYLAALESESAEGEIVPFAQFLRQLVGSSDD